MIGFDLYNSPYFHLGPRLDTLRRHVIRGSIAPWFFDQAVELEQAIDTAIKEVRATRRPSPLVLYRLRRDASELTFRIVEDLGRQGYLDDNTPEGA